MTNRFKRWVLHRWPKDWMTIGETLIVGFLLVVLTAVGWQWVSLHLSLPTTVASTAVASPLNHKAP